MHRLRLACVLAARDDEKVGEIADATHIEDRDIGRLLLLAESGNAPCVLERIQAASVLFRASCHASV